MADKKGAKGKQEGGKRRQDKDCGHFGPGPIYLLPPVTGYPNHDITRYRNPAFSVAGRHDKKFGQTSPGPIYNPGEYNRFGAKFSPKVTINTRIVAVRKDTGPGPATHNTTKYPDPTKPSPPKTTITGRTFTKYRTDGPGPSAYNPNVDAIFPNIPKATLKSRPIVKETSSGPGPGAYRSNYIGKSSPTALVTGRPQDKVRSFGPGPAYSPGNLSRKAPAYSLIGRPDPCVLPYIEKNQEEEYLPNPQRLPICS